MLAHGNTYVIQMTNPNAFQTGDDPKVIVNVKKKQVIDIDGNWGAGGKKAIKSGGRMMGLSADAWTLTFSRSDSYFNRGDLKPRLNIRAARSFDMPVAISSKEEGRSVSYGLLSNEKSPRIKVVPSGSCYFDYEHRR